MQATQAILPQKKRQTSKDSGATSGKKRKRSGKKQDSDVTQPSSMMKQRDNAHANWMFTINNPTNSDIPVPHELVKACVWQKERGADGTEHFQGYIELEQRLRMANVKSKISYLLRSHLELRRGSRQQARDYCVKEDTRIEGPWAFGDICLTGELHTNQGHRSDLDEMASLIRLGTKVEDMPEEFDRQLIRYSKGLKYLETIVSKKSVPTWRQVTVIALWGPTGTGKTRKAIELAGDDYFMLCKSNNKQLWFDGYVGQKTLVMDEFRASWCPFEVLLRILDGHPYFPEQKGGHVCAAWTKVIMTSNINPECWYNEIKITDQSPLFRRITEIFFVPDKLYTDIKDRDVRKEQIKYFPIFKSPVIVHTNGMATVVDKPRIQPIPSDMIRQLDEYAASTMHQVMVTDEDVPMMNNNNITDNEAIQCLVETERARAREKEKEKMPDSPDASDSEDSVIFLSDDDTADKQRKEFSVKAKHVHCG